MSELLTGTGYGRTVALRGSTASIAAARPLLPFWWEDSPSEPEKVFELPEPDAAPLIVRNLERWIAEHAAGVTFVHAAVVAINGRAIVLPGTSYSGKTTLCVELLRRGAAYVSDEYAVLDPTGLVHPYPRSLQLREGDERVPITAASLGAPVAAGGTPVGLLALLDYDVDRGWAVDNPTPAQAILSVLAHTLAGRAHPAETLTAVQAALAGAECLNGSRGSAAEAVDPLVRLIRRT